MLNVVAVAVVLGFYSLAAYLDEPPKKEETTQVVMVY